jgi:leader peptidase (prepilin peptidase) / N-methyltransferase
VPQLFMIVSTAVLGLCIGSFINVVRYRRPLGRSSVRGRSACPSCSGLIAWYDDIPVLSWLLLRGRCRRCRTAISVRYPWASWPPRNSWC